jgi:glycosyltransferase involved in cell wall biosynthesis
MKDRKTTIFLGAYLNFTNAQNLNCRALALNLDKSKFKIYSLYLFSGNLPSVEGVTYFNCFRPLKVSSYLAYAWGIFKSDVVYLPKTDCIKWNRFLLKIFKKKSFSTIEGVLSGTNLEKALTAFGSKNELVKSYAAFDKTYSITNFLGVHNLESLNLKTEKEILHLGVDSDQFSAVVSSKLSDVLLIGNQLQHKGLEDYIILAARFPDLIFHIVGSTSDQYVQDLLSIDKHKNIICHEKLSHQQLNQLFQSVQLHILPSRSEGFPKVILETASAGIPSLVYSDYGASEWITNNKNGFVVNSCSDMIEVVENILRLPESFSKVSESAIALGRSFDWKIIVKRWETEISALSSNNFD